jgi:hypothetical protein
MHNFCIMSMKIAESDSSQLDVSKEYTLDMVELNRSNRVHN